MSPASLHAVRSGDFDVIFIGKLFYSAFVFVSDFKKNKM